MSDDGRLHLHTSSDAPDPLGISSVSGFYGPGTWAGWSLTGLLAWYNILSASSTGSVRVQNIIVYLLGANWAAIDTLRRLYRYKNTESQEEAEKMKGSIAAAVNVTYWGMVVVIAQLLFMLWKKIQYPRSRTTVAKILTIGAWLPALVFMVIFGIFNLQRNETHERWAQLDETLPALYDSSRGTIEHVAMLYGAAFLGLFFFVSLNVLLCAYILQIPLEWDALLGTTLLVGFSVIVVAISFVAGELSILNSFLAFTSIFVNPFSWLIYSISVLIEGGSLVKKSCFFMPCAPQEITEWDQIFALLVGLVLFGLEVWPSVEPRLFPKSRRTNPLGV
ncbi:hypothetical protein EJ04DRAFT_518996 [Polyplosphaeria fusca]|uniref:Uncharacterized protein n=1 Tax=Polyplosphaeria fusca TaxID=682080 RepID=A0A9P4V537_9PLEO|nr:hypothetical protein EJ04DRAFT_518996 [Polyplosphaeria fusca]